MLLELLLVLVSIGALIVLYFRWNYGTLERLGIPVVKTHFLLGSQSDLNRIVGHEKDYEWFETHGNIYGVYNGRQPQIHIVDPDIIRQIFIKDFDKFVNRSFELGDGAPPVFAEMLDYIKDEKWKTVRSALSPIYTTAKLKRMTGHMVAATDDMLNLLKQDIASAPNGIFESNFFQDMFLIAMDATARCTVNVKIKDPRSPDNDFSKALREFFTGKPSFVMILFNLFPQLSGLINPFAGKPLEGFFPKIFQQVMAERRESKEVNDDLIDLMNHMIDRTKTEEYMKLGISETTVLAQGIEFFVAGLDGMATAILAMILYTSKNPEITHKLYEEVDAYFLRNKGEITHDNLGELKYLNACLQEALRLHPAFTRIDRLCTQDVEYKGLKINKGMTVVLPLWPFNRNPKYFPDPHSFDPERFMPHNKNNMDMFTFGTFGHGPRMCIGMRFALECMLIMGAKLFQNFKFSFKPDAKIEYFPTIIPGFSMVIPNNVNISKR